MRVDVFDFHLPPERIALRPIVPRDAARLLVVRPRTKDFEDRTIRDLPDLLNPGDVLVVNDTRVIPARLEAYRRRGENRARIEILLHKRLDATRWLAFAKGAKKLKRGDRLLFSGKSAELEAEILEKHAEGEVLLGFFATGEKLDRAIEALGQMPLPPYIASKRAPDACDAQDYQTLFARRPGAVAAPTASFHFTPELVGALGARAIEVAQITLHVGAGTFLPVKAEDTSAHKMHAEWGEISEEVAARLNGARAEGRRILAVGTTSLRLLESAARQDGTIGAYSGETNLFITPGYKFNAVDLLLTNFHLPRSTLFMLVCAFCGTEVMKAAYAHAIETNYRFYSYGDACLLFPGG
ncbi:MAG TPA: tRNA preQ1(34) S-adenosylmethionine ribosyltransferase-isomerase QueA [Methylovirgula sp.]|nr:tRNA preQ1(34) S-adenosylmethionine ribosyltransferase-isomerase QueA [Methylovirgula sp.]